MTADSGVNVDSGKGNVDEKCEFDVNSVSVTVPEMVVGGGGGDHGEKERSVVNGVDCEGSAMNSGDDHGECDGDEEFSSNVKENGGVGVENWQSVASDELEIEKEEADRVVDRDLVEENGVGDKLSSQVRDDDVVESKMETEEVGTEKSVVNNVDGSESRIENDKVSEMEREVFDEVVDSNVENGFCDHADGSNLGNDDVDEKDTEVDVVDSEVQNGCGEHADGSELGKDDVDEKETEDDVVDSEVQNGCGEHADGGESNMESESVDALHNMVKDEVADSVKESCLGDDVDDGVLGKEKNMINEMETGVNDEVASHKIENGCCDNGDSRESRIGTITIDEMDTEVAAEVGNSDVESAKEVELNLEGVETTTESGLGDHSGTETNVNDEETVMEVEDANDLVNKTDIVCAEDVEMSAIRLDIVEVEQKELDVDNQDDCDSLVTDGVSRSSAADDNVSSLPRPTAEDGDTVKGDLAEKKREDFGADTDPQAIVWESKESEQRLELQTAEIKNKEENFDGDGAQPQPDEVHSITVEDTSQCTQEPSACCDERVEEGEKEDLDAEVNAYDESVPMVDENVDGDAGIEDAGIASTDLSNGAYQMTEISFGTLTCMIPTASWVANGGQHTVETLNSFVSESEGLSNNSAASLDPEENTSDLPDFTNKLTCDEAVDAEGVMTDEASASSVEGSNVGSHDSQILNRENGTRPFWWIIRFPKYNDDKFKEQISRAEKDRDVKAKKRDAIHAQCEEKKATVEELWENLRAAISEEKAAQEAIRTKMDEIKHVQALISRAKTALSIEGVNDSISQSEYRIQHGPSLPLSEERKLVREIEELKRKRATLLSDRSRMQEDQRALDQKEQKEEHLKVLKMEMDALRQKLSGAEVVTKAAKKKLDDEKVLFDELKSKRQAAADLERAAYINLKNLKDKWSWMHRFFHSYVDDKEVARKYADAGDKEALERHCLSQAEKIKEILNKDDELRRSYVRCNIKSTLRRFGTLDGRALGPDEEPLPLSMISNDWLNAASNVDEVATTSNVEHELAVEPEAAIDQAPHMVVEQKDQKNQAKTAKRTGKPTPSKKELAEASKTAKLDEDNEKEKQRNEEEDRAKKAQEEVELVRKAKEESRRKEEEAARLKEQKRLEEKAKAEEARERNRRKAEKAQIMAELRSKKEAEEKEKKREKKAKKKENKKAALSETVSGSAEGEGTSHSDAPQSETSVKEPETSEAITVVGKRHKKPSHYAKQNKIRSIAPPPPALRTRKRRWVKQLMWVLLVTAICLALFIIGNGQNSLLYRILSFGSSL